MKTQATEERTIAQQFADLSNFLNSERHFMEVANALNGYGIFRTPEEIEETIESWGRDTSAAMIARGEAMDEGIIW